MSAHNSDVTEKEIADLLDRWSAAELSGDPTAIGPFLDDDYVGIGPFGFTLTKVEWLQRHESGDLGYTAFALVDTTYQGDPVPGGKLRFSLVVVKSDGEWAVAGFQMSPMGPPPGRPPGR
jgi:hypothetical protein